MCAALYSNDVEIAEMLLKHDADINATDNVGGCGCMGVMCMDDE